MSRLEKAVAELVEALRAELAAPTEPEWISVAAAAERIAMSEKYIRRAITDDRLEAKRFGSALRVRPADVDSLGETSVPRKRSVADTPASRAAAKFRGGR